MPIRLPDHNLKRELLGHHFDYRFQRLTLTHAFDSVGNTLVAISLAGSLFFSIPSGEAKGKVLLYLIFTMAPFAVVSAVLGPLLDRGDGVRRIAVIVAGFGRTLFCWWMATRVTSFALFPLSLGVLVCQRLYSITRASLVPLCLPADEPLVVANSFLVRTSAIAGFVAALIGVIVNKVFHAGGVLRLAAFVYLCMGVAGFLLPSPPKRDGRPRGGGDPEPEPEKLDRVRAAMLTSGARAIVVLRILGGFLLFMLAFALRREGAGTKGIGLLLLGIGIGALVSSMLAPYLNRHIREDLLVFGAMLASGLATLICAKFFDHTTAAFLAGAVGACFGIGKLAFDSMAQRSLPRNIQGRRFARWETAFQLAWVIGALVPVALTVPTKVCLVLLGLGTIVASIFYALDVTRARRHFEAASGLHLTSLE